MIKALGSLVLFFCCFFSFAQKNIVLNGKIATEKTTSAVESATVYLIHPKDSSVVAYTISDKNGLFKLETKVSSENLIFKVSAEGYQEFSKTIDKLTQNIDFWVLKNPHYSKPAGLKWIQSGRFLFVKAEVKHSQGWPCRALAHPS